MRGGIEEEEAMGCQDGIFIVRMAEGKKYPETRVQPTVGTPEQGMIAKGESIGDDDLPEGRWLYGGDGTRL